MKHTPTPWHVNKGTIRDVNGDVLASIPSNLGDDADEANAAFIVKAVNCHDELVEALKLAVKYMKPEHVNITVIHNAKQALKKAEADA